MKQITLILLIFLTSLTTQAQDQYSTLIDQAYELRWKGEDSLHYRAAFDLFEKAFKTFPDSVDFSSLYQASILAGELKELDAAFDYLTILSELEEDDFGDPGWRYVVGDQSKKTCQNLVQDPRWRALEQQAMQRKDQYLRQLEVAEEEFRQVKRIELDTRESPEQVYAALQQVSHYLPKKQRNYSIRFAINDTVQTSYFIHLPENYQPEKAYPLLLFLHGAVRYNQLADFQTKNNLSGWNRYYTKYADEEEVILVFPQGNKQFNWMIANDGFFMVPAILKEIKRSIHVDDNRVFLTGHSNGATGSFSYLMKDPSLFAGFYGFNTYPKVFTGGTFIENALNRSFLHFSTDEDYYYPPWANDSLNIMMEHLGADFKEHRYTGFPHWFPAFDESEPAYQTLFEDLQKRTRTVFPSTITWEFDDPKNGSIDWLTNIKLDTTQAQKDWHQPLNFQIEKWLDYNDEEDLVEEQVDRMAFDFPRRSGKIKAHYEDNTFTIQTSRIHSFHIKISPKMVDLDQPVRVMVNGVEVFQEKVVYDKSVLLQSFEENRDTSRLWVNEIKISGFKTKFRTHSK